MLISCEPLQEKIKETLLHGLFNWICDLASTKVIVVPGLTHMAKYAISEEFITIKRMDSEYIIYTDFPLDILGKDPTKGKSPLYFRWKPGEYENIYSEGSAAVWLLDKPKKSKK